jgi:hypothetical protein
MREYVKLEARRPRILGVQREGALPVRGEGRAHPTTIERDEPSFSLMWADSRRS